MHTHPAPSADSATQTLGSNDLPAFPLAPLKAVLWDMDGTLVDTEPYWIAAETELVTSHGGSWSEQHGLALVGKALGQSAAVLQQAGVDLSIREIIDYLTASVVAQVRQTIPWRPGARELLAELHQNNVRCAMVTMSEGPLAREIASALEHPYFEFLITGDLVSQGKPHPEPYLSAVAKMAETDPALTAAHCAAVEDSVPGVASAVAAGLLTIAVPHNVPLPDNDDGRVTWESLSGRTAADVREALVRRHSELPAQPASNNLPNTSTDTSAAPVDGKAL